MDLKKILKQQFNYNSFRPGQREVIEAILTNRNTLAMLPTGSGKSLCFQLPAYILEGQVLIVSPLLSLMQDQVEQMMSRGEKRVVALNSFLSTEEKRTAFAQLHKYKFIFISPEMLQVPSIFHRIKHLKISLFVVDEAHCISQWGYDFRPDYQMLGKIRANLKQPLTLALTATATEEIRNDIKKTLQLKEVYEYVSTVDRPNIALSVEHLTDFDHKLDRLYELVENLEPPGIIYFSSRKLAEQVATNLSERGFERVAYYHGELQNEDRILIQQQFLHDQLQIVCATSAFGMGINKENIRYIIHFHPPLQLESYIQEIGRSGRDQQQSIAILLSASGDDVLQYKLAESDLPTEEQVDLFFSLKESGKCTDESIMTKGQFTEVQWRFIQSFKRLKEDKFEHNATTIKKYINERKQIKRQKIVEMSEWIHRNDCLRRKMLKYFAEQRKIDVEQCCSFCGIDYEKFKKHTNIIPKEKDRSRWVDNFDWRERLIQLFTKYN